MIIGIDYSDPRPDYAIEFAELVKWKYPQLADPDLSLRSPLQIAGPPQTLFVRADGEIAFRHSGPFGSTGRSPRCSQQHLGVRPVSDPDWVRPLAAALARARVTAADRRTPSGPGGPPGGGVDLDRHRGRRSRDLVRRASQHAADARGTDRLPRWGPRSGRRSIWPRRPCARRTRRPASIPEGIEVLGSLPPAHVWCSGFDVTAVVGWWQSARWGRPTRARSLPVRDGAARAELTRPAHRATSCAIRPATVGRPSRPPAISSGV